MFVLYKLSLTFCAFLKKSLSINRNVVPTKDLLCNASLSAIAGSF